MNDETMRIIGPGLVSVLVMYCGKKNVYTRQVRRFAIAKTADPFGELLANDGRVHRPPAAIAA